MFGTAQFLVEEEFDGCYTLTFMYTDKAPCTQSGMTKEEVEAEIAKELRHQLRW